MFNINGATKYKYIPNYHDMRGGYDKLSSVVREVNGGIMEDGVAYVFTSKNQKLVKIIRHEHCQQQLYQQRFDDCVSFIRLSFEGLEPIYDLEWRYVVALLECPVMTKMDVQCSV